MFFAQWCNPLALQSEQSGGMGLIPGRAPPLECHDKGSQIRLALRYFCNRSAWRYKPQLHLHLIEAPTLLSRNIRFVIKILKKSLWKTLA